MFDIITASIGHYKGGMHHIAADTEFCGTADGHLVLSGGIVSGDFTLQMNYDSIAHGKKAGTQRSHLGSREYHKSFGDNRYQEGTYYFSGQKGFVQKIRLFKHMILQKLCGFQAVPEHYSPE